MFSFVKRKKTETEDWLRYQPFVRRAIGRCKLLSARVRDNADMRDVARSIQGLCAAARLTDGPLEQQIQSRIVRQAGGLDWTRFDWSGFAAHFGDGKLHKGAILKPYVNPGERGVIFVSFENHWIKLLGLRDLNEFARRYTLVIAPSSSPHNLINYVFPTAFPGPIFTLISNPHDQDVLPGVSNRLNIVPLYASNWVNPDLYRPLPKAEREFDLIMVASWGKVKRHEVLFSALRTMPSSLRVLLIGQDQDGRTADTIRELAGWYGVQDRFTILSNQPYERMTQWFCNSRASVVLSKREGSCVVVTESMFANTPVAVLRGAELGSRVYVNDETGRFLDETTLARGLTEFVHEADRYEPRAWAERSISCYRSSQILNDVLREHALADEKSWTLDIAPLHWAPDPAVAREADRVRLATEWHAVRQRFGLEIGPPPIQ